MKLNKPLIASALFIGLLSNIWAAITWLPLALGNQVCQYSEYNQAIAVFEFSCILIGTVFVSLVFIIYSKTK